MIGRPKLDGQWPALGQDAFDWFVRLTADAIVAELSANNDIAGASVMSPGGHARVDPGLPVPEAVLTRVESAGLPGVVTGGTIQDRGANGAVGVQGQGNPLDVADLDRLVDTWNGAP